MMKLFKFFFPPLSLSLARCFYDLKWEFNESMNFFYTVLMNSNLFCCFELLHLWERVGFSFRLFDRVKKLLVIETRKKTIIRISIVFVYSIHFVFWSVSHKFLHKDKRLSFIFHGFSCVQMKIQLKSQWMIKI